MSETELLAEVDRGPKRNTSNNLALFTFILCTVFNSNFVAE